MKTPLRNSLLAECYALGQWAATVVNDNETRGVSMRVLHGLGDALDRVDELEDLLGPEARQTFDAGSDATLLYDLETLAPRSGSSGRTRLA